MSAVTVNIFNPNMENASQVMIWASMNLLPTVLGVILLTGVVAAGISSATTFLSLIGTSVANDVFKGKGNSINIGKISMLVASVVVLLFAIFNPPQIFWIMFFGGAIVASSWMPVAVASIMSKRVTKAGAFAGMLTGFITCFVLKLIFNIFNITVPSYLDPTVIGIVANIIAMVIGSAVTKVTDEEKAARAALFVIPEKEKNPKEVKKTLKHLKWFVVLGIIIMIILVLVWGIPVWINK
jgi:sodium/pantothenate symporter